MKNVLFFAFILLSIYSCKKESACATADFAGTWTAKSDCGGSNFDVTTTASGSTLTFSNVSGFDFTDTTFDIDGCDVEGGVSVVGVGEEVTGSLSGNTLTLKSTIGVSVLKTTCNYTLTKK
jgi:hypothetical protein